MEIVDYELFQVPPRWLFLRVETSDGLVGWGEPVLEGHVRTTAEAVRELFEQYLLGEDPSDIQDHWQAIYRGGFYRGGPVLMSALAGVDQALWDLKGKRYEAPVYDLLGGKARDRVRIYHWAEGETPAEIAADARETVEAHGLTALKMGLEPFPLRRVEGARIVKEVTASVAAVREAVGDNVDIGMDFHGRVAKPLAKRLVDRLDKFDLMFVEEPVRPEHNDALPAIAAHTTTPIATGERMYSRGDFAPALTDGAIDVIQPDLSHAGGITEVVKIASMAETYDVALAPHCPLGPVAQAACLQVDVHCPNALIQEQSGSLYYSEENEGFDYIKDPDVLTPEEGYVDAPTGPGLGIEVDEELVRANAREETWTTPRVRHDDGSVGEW